MDMIARCTLAEPTTVQEKGGRSPRCGQAQHAANIYDHRAEAVDPKRQICTGPVRMYDFGGASEAVTIALTREWDGRVIKKLSEPKQ
jgi:hypothetical protein